MQESKHLGTLLPSLPRIFNDFRCNQGEEQPTRNKPRRWRNHRNLTGWQPDRLGWYPHSEWDILFSLNHFDLCFGEAIQLVEQCIDGAMDVLWAGTRPAPTYGLW